MGKMIWFENLKKIIKQQKQLTALYLIWSFSSHNSNYLPAITTHLLIPPSLLAPPPFPYFHLLLIDVLLLLACQIYLLLFCVFSLIFLNELIVHDQYESCHMFIFITIIVSLSLISFFIKASSFMIVFLNPL